MYLEQVTKGCGIWWEREERNAWFSWKPWAMESPVSMESGGTMLIHHNFEDEGAAS